MQFNLFEPVEEQLAARKKCHWCDYMRPAWIKKKNCKKCKRAFNPLTEEHFETALKNIGLIKKALYLFRKDLHEMFVESRESRDNFVAWGQLPLALAARGWDESKGKFSTYAVRALRNHLNRDYPLGTVGAGENETVNLSHVKSRKTLDAKPFVSQSPFDALIKSRVAVNVDEAIEVANGQIDKPMSRVVVDSRLRMFQDRFPKFWKHDETVGA